MDSDKAKKLERRLKKRNYEKQRVDAPMNNDCRTDMAQEETFAQDGQKKKRKKLNNISNDATINMDISKEDLNKNVKDLSKRQLKKRKATLEEIKKKKLREQSAMEKAYSYVLLWKRDRNEWKFEKLKQIWLIDHSMYKQSISNKIFPVVLEYFKDCKGMARKVLVQKAMEIIRKAEAETNDESKRDIMESITYKRAREILQTLSNDKE